MDSQVINLTAKQIEKEKNSINQSIQNIEKLIKTDTRKAVSLCLETIERAEIPSLAESPFHDELAILYIHLGALYLHQADYPNAIRTLYNILPFYEKRNNPLQLGRVKNIIATANSIVGNFYEALHDFFQCIDLFKEANDTPWEASMYNNIAFQYYELENYRRALDYLQTAKNLAESSGDPQTQAIIYGTYCDVLNKLGKFDEAMDYGEKGITIWRKIGDENRLSEALISKGDLLTAINLPDEAMICFQEAYQMAHNIGNRLQEIECLQRFGNHYLNIDEFEKSTDAISKAFVIAKNLKSKKPLYECHFAFYHIYKKSGDFKKSLENHEQYFQLYKEVYTSSQQQRSEALEIMHEVESATKDAEIARLKNISLEKEIQRRKKAQAALLKMASRDVLTGLSNRRHFFEQCKFVIKEEFSLDINSKYSIFMIDIDGFKKVNDQFGHAAGDVVLKNIGRTIKSTMRKKDISCRYGGEEFVIMLPGTDIHESILIADRLRKTISELTSVYEDQEIMVTVSIGVSSDDCHADINLERLINNADMKMYEAKKDGGDRVSW